MPSQPCIWTDHWFSIMCQRTRLNRLILKIIHSSSQVSMQMVMKTVNNGLMQDEWQQLSGHGSVKMQSSSTMSASEHYMPPMVMATDSLGMLTMVMEQTISTITVMAIQQVPSCSVGQSPLTIHSVTTSVSMKIWDLWIRPVTPETARFTTTHSISKKVSIPSGTEAMAMVVL